MAESQLLHGDLGGNEHLAEAQLLHDALAGNRCDPAAHVARRIPQGMSFRHFAKTAGVTRDDVVKLLRRESCSTATWFAIERAWGPRLGYVLDIPAT